MNSWPSTLHYAACTTKTVLLINTRLHTKLYQPKTKLCKKYFCKCRQFMQVVLIFASSCTWTSFDGSSHDSVFGNLLLPVLDSPLLPHSTMDSSISHFIRSPSKNLQYDAHRGEQLSYQKHIAKTFSKTDDIHRRCDGVG
jgi:hypothetical protein